MKSKPYADKDWLRNRYVVRKMTAKQIAQECTDMGAPTTEMTIFNWLKKFGLLTQSRNLGSRTVGGNGRSNGYY